MTLPALLSREAIHARLQVIFPEGTPHRNYCVREMAASTVFCALYVGAVEGSGTLFGPKHVYRMTDEQAALITDDNRAAYAANLSKKGWAPPGRRWYSDNTREPIRDETLRDGLVAVGAVTERSDVATTSSRPRYALAEHFAALFDPALTDAAFEKSADEWRAKWLNKGALARIAIVRQGAVADANAVTVTLPNGQIHHLKAGQSSDITKAVIEIFARRFLIKPVVLFISESGKKIVARHDELARSIGLNIKADRNLPDTILADLGTEHPLLVFVEAVATDGPINNRRKTALEQLATEAGFPLEHVAFVTAYWDRSGSPFKKTIDSLAWGSFAWFVSEPEGLVQLTVGKNSLS